MGEPLDIKHGIVFNEVAISMRDHDETWICVLVKEGGIIVLPAGVYHRFTLDTDKYTELIRNFTPSILVTYNASFVMFEREATRYVGQSPTVLLKRKKKVYLNFLNVS
ncbi:hypothetical protein ACFE04_018286 [Oxalis oulophora]